MPRILNIKTFESAFRLIWRVIIRGSIGSTNSATRVELIPVFNISGRRMKVGKLNKTKFIILKKNKNRYNYKDDFGISYCKLCFHAHKWTHE